jgi:hypothetical protein
MLKAGFSTAAETDSSVWSSDSLLVQAYPLRVGWDGFSFAGRFEVIDGSSLLRIVWPLPSPLDSEDQYYGFC